MLTVAITLGVILGGSACAVWFANSRFQPEIERNIGRIEAVAQKEETIVAKRGKSNNIN